VINANSPIIRNEDSHASIYSANVFRRLRAARSSFEPPGRIGTPPVEFCCAGIGGGAGVLRPGGGPEGKVGRPPIGTAPGGTPGGRLSTGA